MNQSFAEIIFLNILNIAQVTPIYKKEDTYLYLFIINFQLNI